MILLRRKFSRGVLPSIEPRPDFALSVVSLHEQVLGAHNFINRARTNTDIIRGYSLLLEIR